MATIQHLSLPAAEAGAIVVTGGSAWAAGSWVVLTNAIGADISVNSLCFEPPVASGADTTNETLFEIGVGATGSETVKIQLPFSIRKDTAANGVGYEIVNPYNIYFPEPLVVSAGSCISVRASGTVKTATYDGVKLFYNFTPVASVTALEQFTADHSTKIATGASTTDGVSTNIFLDGYIASTSKSDTLTYKAEQQPVGTAFTGTASETQAITLQYDPENPHVRHSMATVFDPTRKRMIMFGGRATPLYNDVWEFTLDGPIKGQWRQLNPTGTPPTAMTSMGAVFDNTNNRMLVGFGSTGSDTNSVFSLSFASSRDGAWTTLSPTGTIPATRSQTVWVNDPTNTKFYMLGGWGVARLNDIQEFNYSTTNGAWTAKSADGAAGAMSRRNDTSGVWDNTNSRLIIFGGYDGTLWLNDTWEYVPSTNTWTDKTAVFSGTAPSTRTFIYQALDTTNNRMVIFGGRAGTTAATVRTDMAYLTLAAGSETWNVVAQTAGDAVYGSWSTAGCYDPNNKLFLCFGGTDSSLEDQRNLLAIDCSSSSTLAMGQVTLNQWFRDRDAMGYAYNPDLDHTLIVGGYARVDPTDTTFINGDHTNDMWIYRHATQDWVQAIRNKLWIPFTNREGATVVYDTNRNRFIIWGGLTGNSTTANTLYNDVWSLAADTDGIYRLTKLAPTGTKPTSRWLSGVGYDAVNDRMIMFGGDDRVTGFMSDLWQLSFAGGADGAWSTLSATGTGPSALRQPSYAMDTGSNMFLISMGDKAAGGFWGTSFRLDLTAGSEAWSAVTTTGAPTARRGMICIYRTSDDSFYFFGGYDGTNHLNDSYSLTSGATPAWSTLTPTGTLPEARRSHAAGYSPTSDKMMITHGRADTAATFASRANTYEMAMSSPNWAQVVSKVWLEAGVPATSLSTGNYHWQAWATGGLAGDSSAVSYGGNAESAADFTIGSGSPAPSVSDTVTVTEDIVLYVPLPIDLFDSVTVTENTVVSVISAIGTLTDNFDDNSIDNAKWGIGFSENPDQVQEIGQKLVLTPTVLAGGSIATLISLNAYDLTGGTIFVEVPQVSGGDITVTGFRLSSSMDINGMDNYLEIHVSGPDLGWSYNAYLIGGSSGTTPYNATTHRWWKIRQSGGTLYWDYSADGISWTNFHSQVVAMNVSGLYVYLLVNELGSDSPNPAWFDNLNIPPPVVDSITISEDVVLQVIGGIETPSPGVFDSITVSESIYLSYSLPSPIVDSVTVTEDIVLYVLLSMDVFDSVTVTEDVVLDITSPADVFDTVTITEDISLSISTSAGVSDLVTITDVPEIVIQSLVPEVFDTVTVTENIVLETSSPASVSDLVTVSEDFQSNIDSYIFVSDTVTVTEDTVLSIPLPPSGLFEEVTITENIALSILLPVSVFDTATLTENISAQGIINISVFEEVTITDLDDQYIQTFFISVFEDITLTESAVMAGTEFTPMVDSVTVTEDIQLTVLSVEPLAVNVFDSVTITEDISLNIPLPVDVFDSITVSENIDLYILTLYLSLFDSVTVSENLDQGEEVTVDVFDSVTITENIGLYLTTFYLSVFESVTITESLQSGGENTLNVFDSVTVSENLDSYILTLYLSVSDSITVIENLSDTTETTTNIFDSATVSEDFQSNVLSYISVFDSATVSESVQLTALIFLSVSDLVTVSESTTKQVDLPTSIFDQVTVTESIALFIPELFISVSEDVTISESLFFGGQGGFSVYDDVTVSEDIILYVTVLYSPVSDLVTISENVSLSIPLPVSVFDTATISENVLLSVGETADLFDLVTVSENIVLSIAPPANVFDSVTISENVDIYIVTQYLFVFDSVTVTENLSDSEVTTTSVSDSVTVSENVSLDILLPISVFDSITVTEAAQISYSLPSPIFDSVTVTDVPTIQVDLLQNVFDEVTVTDVTTQYIPMLFISVTENITVDEFFQSGGENTFFILDLVQVTEDISLYIPVLYLSTDDLVTVTEFVQISYSVPPLFELVTITEEINLSIPVTINVSDLVIVTGNIQLAVPLSPDVSDLVTVSENIVLSVPLPVIVSDLVTVTENIVLAYSIPSPIFDLVTVTESIQISLSLPSPVFEQVTITESVNLSVKETQEVFDLITVTENLTLYITTFYLSVLDTVTVSENLSDTGTEYISIFDQVTVSENFRTDTLSYPSVFDSVIVSEGLQLAVLAPSNVFDSVTVTEVVTIGANLLPTVIDLVTVSEDTTIFIPALYLSVSEDVGVSEFLLTGGQITFSVFDNVGVTEDTALLIPTLFISTFDSVTISEDIVLSVPLPIVVSDSVTVTDVLAIFIPTLVPNVFDLSTVTEDISLRTLLPISVFDSVTISEDIALSVPLPINVSDSITISEDIQISISLPSPIFELITISESISLSVPLPTGGVFDSITVSESISLSVSLPTGGVFEMVAVTEDISLSVPLPTGGLFDTVTVTEAVTTIIPLLVPSVSDTVTITDVLSPPTISSTFQVSDLVTLSENIGISVIENELKLVSVSDSVVVSEVTTFSITTKESLFDLVTVSDEITLVVLLFASVSDAVTVTEGIQLTGVDSQSIFDSITVTESLVLYITTLVPSVSDLVTISESISISVLLQRSISDSITITENTTIQTNALPSVFDSVTVSESLAVGITTQNQIFETITVSEDIVFFISIPTELFDSVTVTENISLSITLPISVYDSVALSEGAFTSETTIWVFQMQKSAPQGSVSRWHGLTVGGGL